MEKKSFGRSKMLCRSGHQVSDGSVFSVAYLKAHEMEYPRNQRLREALQQSTTPRFSVDEVGSRGFQLSIRDLLAFVRAGRESDILLLAEFQLKHALFAALAARLFNRVLIVDGFVGRYEGLLRRVLSPHLWVESERW